MNLELLKHNLAEQFGCGFLVSEKKTSDGYTRIQIRPEDIEPAQGFIIKVEIRWRMIGVEFVPESYAAPLIKTMSDADLSKKTLFLSFVRSAQNLGIKIKLLINGRAVHPEKTDDLSGTWTDFSFSLSKLGVHADNTEDPKVFSAVGQLLSHAVGMTVSLLLQEDILDHDDPLVAGLPEGAKTRVEINRYERSRLNREACIAHHGTCCSACGIDLKKIYGELGDGFIHVHHITPVSAMGEDYIVDPQKDLFPVCPNCHAMLHRRNPPLMLDELKTIIRENEVVI